MVGLVLKNIILVVLIILILHFMIKNALLDKDILSTIRHRKKQVPPPRAEDVSHFMAALREDDAALPGLASGKRQDILKYDEGYIKKCKETQMKELYRYVFDQDASGELAGFYTDAAVDMGRALDPSQQVKCEPSENSNLVCGPKPLCPTTIDKHFNERTKSSLPVQREKAYRSRQVINEYANEDVITGGAIDNLLGYDGFHSQFAEVSIA